MNGSSVGGAHGASGRVRVDEADDPNGSSTDYASVERAKQSVISIALELFDTEITAAELGSLYRAISLKCHGAFGTC